MLGEVAGIRASPAAMAVLETLPPYIILRLAMLCRLRQQLFCAGWDGRYFVHDRVVVILKSVG